MPQRVKTTKDKGNCCHCQASRKLYWKDGLVRLQGPRDDPCPGSSRPPLQACDGDETPQVKQALDGSHGAGSEDHSRARGDILDRVPDTVALETDGAGVSHPTGLGSILKHVCKGARPACAQALTTTLQEACKVPHSTSVWQNLFHFAPTIFAQPARAGKRHNLTKTLKNRTEKWRLDPTWGQDEHPPARGRMGRMGQSEALPAAVTLKLEDRNIKAAVRILCEGVSRRPPLNKI